MLALTRATSWLCKPCHYKINNYVAFRTRPWPYLIGILECDLKGVIDLLNENNDSAAPLIIQLNSQKVGLTLLFPMPYVGVDKNVQTVKYRAVGRKHRLT